MELTHLGTESRKMRHLKLQLGLPEREGGWEPLALGAAAGGGGGGEAGH